MMNNFNVVILLIVNKQESSDDIDWHEAWAPASVIDKLITTKQKMIFFTHQCCGYKHLISVLGLWSNSSPWTCAAASVDSGPASAL